MTEHTGRRVSDAPEEIKKAVKDALDDKRMDDIGHQLTNLSTQLTQGFAEVHTRQDAANGKLVKHDIELQTLKGNNIYTNVLWFLVTSLVGALVYLITHK